jgi:hypothetical protein
MSGKTPRLSPLQSRKDLLLAESELNRALLVGEMTAMAEDVRSLKDRARSFGSIASAIAMLGLGLAAFRRGKAAAGEAKPSWLQTLLKSTGLVSTLWAAFRTQRGHRDETSRSDSRS